MKKLIIYDYEIVSAEIPFPYLTMDESAFKKWLEIKLLKTNFNLTKPIFKEYDLEKAATIYYQKDK